MHAEGKLWDEIAVALRRTIDDVTIKGYALGLRMKAAPATVSRALRRRVRVKRAD